MRYNKKIILLVILIIVTMSFGVYSQEKVEEKILTIMTEKGAHTEAWKSVVPEFEKNNNIKVKVVELPWEQYRQQLNLKFIAGKVGFDLAYIPIGWVPEIQKPGYIVPIEEYGEVKDLELEDFPGIENAYFGKEKQLYFIPYMNETHGILYRTDLFNDPEEKENFLNRYGYELAPPKTIAQYKDIAKFFYRPDKRLYGVTLMGQRGILLGFHFYNRLFNYGGDIFDNEYHPAFNNEAGIKALNDLKDLFNYTSDAAKQYSWMDAAGEFLQGTSAMAEMATTIAQVAQDPNQSKIVGKVGFTGIPLSNANDSNIKRLYLPFGFVITDDSALKEDAFKWIRYVTDKDIMEKAAPVGNIPARYSVLKGKLSKIYPYYSPHADIMANSRLEPLPLIPEGAAVTSDIIPGYISQFLTGELTAKEALKQASSEVETLMESTGYYKD